MNEPFPKKKRDCVYNLNDITTTSANSTSDRSPRKFYPTFYKNLGICKLTIGTWPFNLLETWLLSFKGGKLLKITHGERNSISIDMGMLGQFSCAEDALKHKMTIELKGRVHLFDR